MDEAISNIGKGVRKVIEKAEAVMERNVERAVTAIERGAQTLAEKIQEEKQPRNAASDETPRVPSRSMSADTYDTKFFEDWIESLEAKIKPTLPDLSADEAFIDVCRAVQSANQTRLRAQSVLDRISKQNPVNEKEVQEAKAAVEAAKTALKDVVETCVAVGTDVLKRSEFQKLLADDYNDGDLTTFIILKEAGAKKLADWCQRGENETSQLMGLLHDVDLQREFLQAGGARKGEYGRAIELYHRLTLAADKDPVLQRLAMAVALELCTPCDHFVRPAKDCNEIDSFQRYVHYEQAFLFGELDPAFENFTVWELRLAVNSDASEEELGWGRQSLMNFRPGLVYLQNPQWRYCRIVRTDVAYQNPEWYKNPRSYDQILSGGGKVCSCRVVKALAFSPFLNSTSTLTLAFLFIANSVVRELGTVALLASALEFQPGV